MAAHSPRPSPPGGVRGDRVPAIHLISDRRLVASLPAETRRERVRVQARERNEFQAVLRREDGRSRVSKFRERD